MERLEEVVVRASPQELAVLARLYCVQGWPHVSLTLGEVAKVLGRSKPTAKRVCDGLVRRGLLVKVSAYVMFFYPVRDAQIKRGVLRAIGFFD